MNISSLNFSKAGLYQSNVQAQNTRAPKMSGLTCDMVSFGKNENSTQQPASSFSSKLLLDGLASLFHVPLTQETVSQKLSKYDFVTGKTVLMSAKTADKTKSLLETAKVCGDENLLKEILTQKSNDLSKRTPLMYAGTVEQTQALLDAAPDDETVREMLTQRDAYGNTVLMFAQTPEQSQILLDAINKTCGEDTLQEMLIKKNIDGKTVLMEAQTPEQAQVLLDAASDDEILKTMLTQRSLSGKTAYHYAYLNVQRDVLCNAAPDKETLEDLKIRHYGGGEY